MISKENAAPTPASPPFREELSAFLQALTDKRFFLVLIVAWVALFHFLGNSTFGYIDSPSIFRWMYEIYNRPDSDDGHGNLIPFVVVALIWWKRAELLRLPQTAWIPGVFLLGLAILLHCVGFAVQQPRLSIIAFFLGLWSLFGLVWGVGWFKALFFPLVLFAFCIPVGSLTDGLTLPLRIFSTKVSFHILQLLGVDLVMQGTQISDPNGAFNYEVAAACSGIRSLISLLALTTIYSMVTFKGVLARSTIIFSTIPLAVGCNVLRLLAIVITAKAINNEAAEFVHEWFGFVTYAISIACVLLLGSYFQKRAKKAGREA